MLINLGEQLKKYNIIPNGIIHVGSHWAEEHDDYLSYGISNFIYIEPCVESFKIMANKLGVSDYAINNYIEHYLGRSYENGINIGMYNYACGSKEDKMIMYVSHNNQGQSNSLLEPNLHLQQHPEVVFEDAEVVKVKRLDDIVKNKEQYNILAIDVQGFEGEVLKGATETLKHIDVVYTEINTAETYKGNALVGEIDELLSDFIRVETYMPSPNWTWGDAVFISKNILSLM